MLPLGAVEPAEGLVPEANPSGAGKMELFWTSTLNPAPSSSFWASSVRLRATSGTVTISGPRDLTSFTVSPRCPVPLAGSWEITCPAATVSECSSETSTVKPCFLSSLLAWSASVPL